MTGHEHNEPELAAGEAGRAQPDPALAPPADIKADARDTGLRSFARDLFSRELLRYLGPGFVVTIGFIDPGNWATNIAGGTQFGYQLLWVISLSTLMLIFLQHMAAKLGIVTGRSLAVNVRAHLPAVARLAARRHASSPPASRPRWPSILGAALGFNLLFGIPVWIGRAAHAGARLPGDPRAAVPSAGAPHPRLPRRHRRLLHHRALHREAGLGRRGARTGSSPA